MGKVTALSQNCGVTLALCPVVSQKDLLTLLLLSFSVVARELKVVSLPDKHRSAMAYTKLSAVS